MKHISGFIPKLGAECRFYGHFTRSFNLPDDVRPENISGEFRDGMLYVHMTKSMPTSAQPLEIEIK